MNIFKKVYNKLYNLLVGLIFGMKNTEEVMFTQQGLNNEVGTGVIKEVESQRVSKALLKGEITQEVEELRYRTYKVDRESKEYEYYAPTLALKREKQDNKFVKYDNSDNLEIITIQPNETNVESISETLKHINEYGNKETYLIKIDRNFVSRYKIEEYTKRLVVKKLDDKNHVILDFYVSKYPNDKDFKSKGFVKEIEKIKNDKLRSDILDFKEVSFTTYHAFKLYDMLEFAFKNIYFREVVEYDGHYIIRFKAYAYKNGIDLTKSFYSKTMDEKYKNKVKKDIVLNITGSDDIKTYICSECGKEVMYNTDEMEELPIFEPRDIYSDENELSNVTEYMDMQVSEQTFGKPLCRNCLKKYLENNKI